jgi:glycosyltransferase involved in cell wall biosynthesis
VNGLIVTTEPFPIGLAATNRIRSYSKGLIQLGVNLKILSLKTKTFGEVDGIKYKGLKITNNKFIGFILACIRIVSECDKEIDFLVLVSNKYLLGFYLSILCRIFDIKLILEKSEFPFVLKNKSLSGRIYASFYISTFYRFFDGLFVMTKSLYDYFKPKVRNQCQMEIILMTTEMERFIGDFKKKIKDDYIAYCGFMGDNKDGVGILIESFSKISEIFGDLKLVLIGDGPDLVVTSFKEKVKKIGIESKVVFTGRVHRDLIPNYLTNAKILALARPISKQSSFGFPTKLGEYLSTGVPVLVTNVGEITDYLTHGKNAFIAKPDDVNDFADKLLSILRNYEEARKIGLAGKSIVISTFNYQVQSKKLFSFISGVLDG